MSFERGYRKDVKQNRPTNKCDNPRCLKLKCHHTFDEARVCQQSISADA